MYVINFAFQDASKSNGIVPKLVDSVCPQSYNTNAYVNHYSSENSIKKWQGNSKRV